MCSSDLIIISSLMIAMHEAKIFEQFDESLSLDINMIGTTEESRKRLGIAFDFFKNAGFVEREGSKVTLTKDGLVAVDRALAYGVTVSYDPSYRQARRFLSGVDPAGIERTKSDGKEALVNRSLNVRGSGAAHATYFRQTDKIIKELIDQMVESGGILGVKELSKGAPFVLSFPDTGSGDGKNLEHIYRFITGRNRDGSFKTKYGALMAQNPELYKLEMIGVDPFSAAREEATATLSKAGISHMVIPGYIEEPDKIVKDVRAALKGKYGDSAKFKVIHTRTFLDHNRRWQDIEIKTGPHGLAKRKAIGTGTFGWRGKAFSNKYVEQNLYEYLRRWYKALESEDQDELLVTELHTASEQMVASNLRKTLDIAYQLSHLFSDQFIVEEPVFRGIADEAGFESDPRFIKHYPDIEGLTTVSQHLLRRKKAPATAQVTDSDAGIVSSDRAQFADFTRARDEVFLKELLRHPAILSDISRNFAL